MSQNLLWSKAHPPLIHLFFSSFYSPISPLKALHLPVHPHPSFPSTFIFVLLCYTLFFPPPPPAYTACLALVFTPRYLFLYLHLFALIVPASPSPSGPVFHGVSDGLNGTLTLSGSFFYPSDPSLSHQIALPLTFASSIPSLHSMLFIIHESGSEGKKNEDASAASRGPLCQCVSVSVCVCVCVCGWLQLGSVLAQWSSSRLILLRCAWQNIWPNHSERFYTAKHLYYWLHLAWNPKSTLYCFQYWAWRSKLQANFMQCCRGRSNTTL